MCIKITCGFKSTGIILLSLIAISMINSIVIITLSGIVQYYHVTETPFPTVTSRIDQVSIISAISSIAGGIWLFRAIVCKANHDIILMIRLMQIFFAIFSLAVAVVGLSLFSGFCPSSFIAKKPDSSECEIIYVLLKVIGSLHILNFIIHMIIFVTVKSSEGLRWPQYFGEETPLLIRNYTSLNTGPPLVGNSENQTSSSPSSSSVIVVTSERQPLTTSSSAPITVGPSVNHLSASFKSPSKMARNSAPDVGTPTEVQISTGANSAPAQSEISNLPI